MSITTLKFFRLLIPGILIVVLFLIFMTDNRHELIEFTKVFSNFQLQDTIFVAVFLSIGAIYYILHIRNLLWNPYFKRVQNNIKNTLISPLGQEVNEEQKNYLKDGNKLMIVFYYFIDNDNSLAEKANRVRFNGLIWTSTIDLTIIAAFGSLILWGKLAFENTSYNIWMGIILFIIALISLGLIQLTTRHHISLSNEQLESICQAYETELKEKIYGLLQNQ